MNEFYQERISDLRGECLPCPFCGESKDLDFDSFRDTIQIRCNNCGACGPFADGYGEYDTAVKMWNDCGKRSVTK